MKIKKGDKVIIMKGKDAGKKGTILAVFPKMDSVLVEGMNMKKRHKRAPRGGKGTMIDIAHPVRRSNVSLLDPKGGKPTRIGAKMVGDKKVRVAKKSGQEV
jgi:large subunit ribosomal protein L24